MAHKTYSLSMSNESVYVTCIIINKMSQNIVDNNFEDEETQ